MMSKCCRKSSLTLAQLLRIASSGRMAFSQHSRKTAAWSLIVSFQHSRGRLRRRQYSARQIPLAILRDLNREASVRHLNSERFDVFQLLCLQYQVFK